MPTTDENTIIPVGSQRNDGSQTHQASQQSDDFDLEITDTKEAPNPSSSPLENNIIEGEVGEDNTPVEEHTGDSLDFSLDLPDTYPDQAQASSEIQANPETQTNSEVLQDVSNNLDATDSETQANSETLQDVSNSLDATDSETQANSETLQGVSNNLDATDSATTQINNLMDTSSGIPNTSGLESSLEESSSPIQGNDLFLASNSGGEEGGGDSQDQTSPKDQVAQDEHSIQENTVQENTVQENTATFLQDSSDEPLTTSPTEEHTDFLAQEETPFTTSELLNEESASILSNPLGETTDESLTPQGETKEQSSLSTPLEEETTSETSSFVTPLSDDITLQSSLDEESSGSETGTFLQNSSDENGSSSFMSSPVEESPESESQSLTVDPHIENLGGEQASPETPPLQSELPVSTEVPMNTTSLDSMVAPKEETTDTSSQSDTEPTQLLNLDQMVSQYSTSNQQEVASTDVSTMDPFDAMKATLAPATEEVPQPDIPQSETPQSLDQNSVSTPISQLQEAPSSEVQNTETQTQNTPTLEPAQTPVSPQMNLDILTSPMNTFNNQPLSEVSFLGMSKQKMMPILLGIGGFIIVVAGGFLISMRWPDLFTGTSTPSQDGQVQLTMTGDQELQEHTSAPDTSDSTPTTGENEDTTTPEIKPTTPVEVTGDFSTGTGDDEAVETIVLGDTSSEEQTTSETDTKTNTPTEVSVESPATSSQTGDETSASDPLGAVEGLVGNINNDDLMLQEIKQYNEKGKELKELGMNQSLRKMMKYGLAVEKETQILLDSLVNGEKIDISKWTSLKAELDGYIEKANNV